MSNANVQLQRRLRDIRDRRRIQGMPLGAHQLGSYEAVIHKMFNLYREKGSIPLGVFGVALPEWPR